MGAVDPAGESSYLVVWFGAEGEVGHSGFAVDNYVDTGGRRVKDGTLSYFDLWPLEGVSPFAAMNDVTPDYNRRVICSLSDLQSSDPSVSGTPNAVSEFGEGRPPDGIVELPTIFPQDVFLMAQANALVGGEAGYNAATNNCSTFVESLISLIFPEFDASTTAVPTRGMRMLGFKERSVVSPNALYNRAAELRGAKIVKGPQKVPELPIEEYAK